MNNRRNFLEINIQEYLGIPFREENLPIDEILSDDIFVDTNFSDPNGTYRQVEIVCTDYDVTLTTGDKQGKATVPFDAILVAAQASVDTPSTAGTVQVSLSDRNGNDILAGWLEIDANETGSQLGTYGYVINSTYAQLKRHDSVYVNVDSVGTASKGFLIVTLYFVVSKFYSS